jgi:hypothetical protein
VTVDAMDIDLLVSPTCVDVILVVREALVGLLCPSTP